MAWCASSERSRWPGEAAQEVVPFGMLVGFLGLRHEYKTSEKKVK